MSQSSRIIKVHPDALVEWIQDDNFFYQDQYSIINDTLNNETSFTFSSNAVDVNNYNKIPNQLYMIDSIINKYGIANPVTKAFLQESQYTNNAPSKFDKIKIWFPISWTFPNMTGFHIKMWALNYENSVPYNLTNFFLDTSIPANFSLVQNEPVPFRYGERLWGKSITIYVPSVYQEALNRTGSSPTLGSINQHLAGIQNGLSQTTPIFLDFKFLTSKSIVLGETTFLSTPSLVVSIPQAPEYLNLAVQIDRATDGDYFKINGSFNGTIGEFDQFMSILEQSGKRSYVLFSITTFEEGLPQDTQDIYKYTDFFKYIDYSPILKITNTTASIQIEMKLINAVDGSIISRFAEIALVGSEVAKYSKTRQAINITNAFKPKIYNSKPDNLILPSQDVLKGHINRKIKKREEDIRYVPYPVLTDTFNVISQDVTTQVNGATFFRKGGLTIELTPFDNVIKFKIAQLTGTNSQGPFTFPSSGSIIQLVFKSATSQLRVPLWNESGQNNLTGGILVFKQVASDHTILKKVFETNQNFYITITTNGIETSIYDGKFSLLEDVPRSSSGDTLVINNAPPKFTFSNINFSSFTEVSTTKQETKGSTKGGSTQKKSLELGLSAKQLKNIS